MRYKTDTRTDFDIITPLYSSFDADLADQLNDLVDQSSENGRNLIFDLANLEEIRDADVQLLCSFHSELYQHDLSFVLCHIHSACRFLFNETNEAALNIAPTLQEAIDLVSMEVLERELLGSDDVPLE